MIFDLDCTLADRRRSIDAYLEHFLERFGKLLKTSDPQTVRDVLGQADGNGYSADTRAADIVNALDWTRKPQAKVVDKHWHTSFPGCTVAMGRVNCNLALSRALGDFEYKQNKDLPAK